MEIKIGGISDKWKKINETIWVRIRPGDKIIIDVGSTSGGKMTECTANRFGKFIVEGEKRNIEFRCY